MPRLLRLLAAVLLVAGVLAATAGPMADRGAVAPQEVEALSAPAAVTVATAAARPNLGGELLAWLPLVLLLCLVGRRRGHGAALRVPRGAGVLGQLRPRSPPCRMV
jgi:hypothetical protein